MEFDTITALFTPMGEGAIAIVCLSGDEAVVIVDKIFRLFGGKSLITKALHTIYY
ncbi:tRNA uridine-5-carboxymethylaminomethyl(34) synthesis GTPase MnmE, partial [Lysinibacillus agricola]